MTGIAAPSSPSRDRQRAYNRAYYAANREKWRVYRAAYEAKLPDGAIRAYQAAYQAANREELRAWRAANCEKRRATTAAWRAANLEKVRAYRASHRDEDRATTAVWRSANPEKVKVYTATWRAANLEKFRAKAAAYRVAHPDAQREYKHRRRARKAGNGGTYTTAEWRAKLAEYGNACAYCRRSDVPMTVDHQIPIVRGGRNDIDNIVPACKSCNSRKHIKTVEEFAA